MAAVNDANEAPTTRFPWLTLLLLTLAVGMPFGIHFLLKATAPQAETLPVVVPVEGISKSILSLTRSSLGPEKPSSGIITHVKVVDFDGDGHNDVIASDAQAGRVIWYRQHPPGQWKPKVLNADRLLGAPATTHIVDLDGDGDRDVLVAVLGSYTPTDERVGKVAWLENLGDFKFRTRILLENVRRVSDVRAGDLDGDGDQDLVVAVFGYMRGKIAWLENDGRQGFREHELLAVPGTIHVPIGDFDRDGDLDIVALVSQDEEAVWAFENLGGKTFQPKRRTIFETSNFDLGTAGLVANDLDGDGDLDFLLSAGDNLELQTNAPQPWHGCLWLENRGGWKFVPKRLATLGGTYAAAVGDLDGDGDNDVALVSMFNDWNRKHAASVVWLENDGLQNFITWKIPDAPIQLATVACGDLNGDGRADIVAGSFQFMAPFIRPGRITVWTSRPPGKPGIQR